MKIVHTITREEASPVLQLFNYFHTISRKAEDFIVDHLFTIDIKKGTILHEAGNICENLHFIAKGALRCFIIDGHKDTTTWITVEQEIVSAIYSFIHHQPSIEYIQAIEHSFLFAMSHKDLKEMYELFPETNIVARCLYEKYYSDAEVRALVARLKNAERKYEFFLESYSHLSNRIPLKYISSFLGINQETLSRVRALKARKA